MLAQFTAPSQRGLALHETKHVIQSDIAGGLKFQDGKLQNAGNKNSDKINNEVQSYQVQFSLNGFIPKTNNTVIEKSADITPTVVRAMKDENGKPLYLF